MKHFYFSVIIALSVFLLVSCGTETTPIYTLTTSVNGEGTITPSSGEFEEGETVTITSSPTNGWFLESWSGDISVNSITVSITMDSDKNVVGNFLRRDYPLTITIEGEGTVQERILSQPKSTDYPFETVVELNPIPSNGWEFVEWGGDLRGSNSPQSITVDSEKTVSVIFKQNNFFLHENGVTIMCPDTQPGDIGIVDGVEYESVDRDLLIHRRDEGFDLTKLCTSLVTDMNRIFREMFTFNEQIENWDVSNVIDMTQMFSGSSFDHSIEDWDVSNVKYMDWMFYLSNFNKPIGNWDTGNVVSMRSMFSGSNFNLPIESWDVSNVQNMLNMFRNTDFDQPIGNWDVGNVNNMTQMFGNSNFNQPLNDWDVSNVSKMEWMFDMTPFNQDISNWCVSIIISEPSGFSTNSPLKEENKPIWGTCPD